MLLPRMYTGLTPKRYLQSITSIYKLLENNVKKAFTLGSFFLVSKLFSKFCLNFCVDRYEGLSELFLTCPVPKLLLLAGTDRLDRFLSFFLFRINGTFEIPYLYRKFFIIYQNPYWSGWEYGSHLLLYALQYILVQYNFINCIHPNRFFFTFSKHFFIH